MKRIAGSLALVLATTAGAQAEWEAGVQAFQQGNYTQAIQELQEVTSENPEWADGHWMLGSAQLKAGRTTDAVASLRRAYDLDPSTKMQFALGQAYVAVGQYADGGSILGKMDTSVLSAEQRGVHAQLLAKALSESGQTDRAIAELAKAAQARPDDAAVQYQYGAAALNAGDTDAAVRALTRAAQLDASPDVLRALTKARIREGRESQGETKLAAYRQATQTASQLVTAEGSYDNVVLLGEAQLGGRQYSEAAATFQRAAGLNSGDWLAQYYLGQAYTASGDYGRAEPALRRALDLTSASADQVKIWGQLGFVYEKQRSWDQAKTAYGRAGNQAAIQRVATNQETAEHNQEVDQYNKTIEELEAEREELERELGRLPGAGAGEDDDEDDDEPPRR